MKIHDGFVELMQVTGSDALIKQCAKVSNEYVEIDDVKKNSHLIDYLLRNEHGTPFEHVSFRFHIRCPIFVMRQLIRHRVSTVNETSGRYRDLDMGYYIPELERIQSQSTDNKQGSSGIMMDDADEFRLDFISACEDADARYHMLLEAGVSKELARIVIPVAAYTEFIWTINLRSMFNFLKLRTDRHAQVEIRELAWAIDAMVTEAVPQAMNAFNEYIRYAVKVPATVWDQIKDKIDPEELTFRSNSEKQEFIEQLRR